MEKQHTDLAMKVSVVSLIVNVVLSAAKLIAGIAGHSAAMISDAVHSASDVFSTFVVMLGISISSKRSDDTHQYGHEKIESVAGITLAIILFATGVLIGIEGVKKIFSRQTIQTPAGFALVMAVISIAVKEWMFRFTKSAAQKINSGALMADAWHHRSDALSSIGSFAGILGARMGMPVMDSVAGCIISIFIAKAAIEIFKDSTDKLVDKSCDEKTEKDMYTLAENVEGVISVDEIRTRLFGNKIYVDLEISADGNLSLYSAHDIAQTVHDKMEERFPLVKHCMVHVNPK